MTEHSQDFIRWWNTIQSYFVTHKPCMKQWTHKINFSISSFYISFCCWCLFVKKSNSKNPCMDEKIPFCYTPYHRVTTIIAHCASNMYFLHMYVKQNGNKATTNEYVIRNWNQNNCNDCPHHQQKKEKYKEKKMKYIYLIFAIYIMG